jgi:hypothetical protein
MGRACSTNKEKRNAYRILMEKPDIAVRIIVKWIFGRQDGVIWTRLIWLRI